MDDLSLADIALFVRAATLGTLSAAARERGVPVSQVSRAIDRIERACAVRLLRRSGRGLSLTHDGESFLAFCRQVGSQRNELEADFSRRAGVVSGRTRMSMSGVIAHFWIVPSLPSLAREHPQLGVDLLVDDDVVDLARAGVDIAIRTGDPATLSMAARPLGRIATGLYASPAYLAEHGEPQEASQLVHHRLLSNCEHPVLNRLRFRDGGSATADALWRSGSTAVIAQMATEGLGIAHLPVRVAAAAGHLQPVLPSQFVSADIPVSAILLPDRQRLPHVRVCVDHLLRMFAPSS
ncbi:LysR family transcriptional regulator [Aquabacterium sp. A7-Y]|uniref:LysR family transcriptional regulator n=1 Tax=Aquabacterium sp. A7-Y TaxID=1349605 RepID=UPI00223CCA33|nr:LysR family transcriptional regulator [Aquabacterium sp. A7-Y]MCW7537969.1 LysR family transcriptional regulator [Aquabacterium sp. A7-Y]